MRNLFPILLAIGALALMFSARGATDTGLEDLYDEHMGVPYRIYWVEEDQHWFGTATFDGDELHVAYARTRDAAETMTRRAIEEALRRAPAEEEPV